MSNGVPVVRRGRRALSVGLAGVLAAAVLNVVPAGSVSAGASAPPAAGDAASAPEGTAVAEARRTGRQVEIPGETTETTRILANPDGTLTEEQSAGPERAQRPDGSWGPIDTSLVKRPDGSVSPVATTVDLELSGGGEAPLVRMTDHGKSLTLDWPGALPAPVVEESTATYAEVLPGVDLQVRATEAGYDSQLMVKSAKAAKSSELDEIRMTLRGQGVELHDPADGTLRAEDAKGEVEFASTEPQMWDASGVTPPARTAAPASVVPASMGVKWAGVAAAGSAGARSGAEPAPAPTPAPETIAAVSDGPAPGSAVAPVSTTLTGTTLKVTPDQRLLADSGTVFPVAMAVQKPFETWRMNGRTVLDSKGGHDWGFDDDANGNGKADHEGEGMGLCDDADPYMSGCGGRFKRRQYYQFNTENWKNKKIYDASFKIRETHAYNCEPSWVGLYLTDSIHGGGANATRWPGPTRRDLLVDRKVAYGWDTPGSSCKGSEAVEFNDSSAEKDENLLPRVKQAAKNWDQITFGLFAKDEDSVTGWKRWNPQQAHLVVTYNTVPAQPTAKGTSDPKTDCKTGEGRDWTNDNTPVLEATGFDRDPQNLKATFVLTGKSLDGKTTYSAINYTRDAPGTEGRFAYQTPVLRDGIYSWSVRTNDGFDDSEVSATCEFAVETVKPDKAPVIEFDAANPYRPGGEVEAGGPSVPGTFTFKANGVADIDHYVWGLDNDQPDQVVEPATAGGDAMVTIKPGRYGFTTLYVRSVDRAGNEYTGDPATGADPYAKHFFEVKRPSCTEPDCPPSAGWWKLESGAARGTDSTGLSDKHPLTFDTGATTVSPGRVGAAIALDGTENGNAQTAVFPSFRTDGSFTVAAWAKLTGTALPTGHRAAVSKDGTQRFGFHLGYRGERRSWAVMLNQAGTAQHGTLAVEAGQDSAKLNVWTHLAATYEAKGVVAPDGTTAGQNQVRLFVNGEQVGDPVPYTVHSNAGGPVRIGQALWNRVPADFWPGAVDEVRIFPGVLTAHEISRLASPG